MPLLFFVVCFLGSPANGLHAQAASELGCPFIRNYTPKEYDAHFQNWAVIQDKRGVMYFGNGFGVLEFDGHHWRLIRMPNHSVVRSLAMDADGTIYVGAVGEFGYLTGNESGFLSYASLSASLPRKDKDFTNVWDTLATSQGIYFKPNNKIFRFHDGSIDVIPMPSSTFGSVVHDRVFFHNDGIYLLTGEKPLLLPHTRVCHRQEAGLLFILPYPDNRILIATERKGFFIYDLSMCLDDDGHITVPGAKNPPAAILKSFPTEIDEYIRQNQLYGCAKVNPNCFAFATIRGGIILMDQKGRLVRVIGKYQGLQRNNVLDIFIDGQQNLWAALNNGIAYIELNSPITRFAETSGLTDIVLTAVRHRGKLYVGAFDGLFSFGGDGSKIPGNQHCFSLVKNITGSCWDLRSTRHGLFAAGNFGVVRIEDGNDLRFQTGRLVYCFGQSKKFPEVLFLGGRTGLAALQVESGTRVTYIGTAKFKGVMGIIRRITGDSQGNLWLTSQYKGIIYVRFTGDDPANHRVFYFSTRHGLPQLNWNRVYCMGERIIVATQKGIYEAKIPKDAGFDPDAVRFVPENTFGKMFHEGSNPINHIVFDKQGKIWIDSDQGLGVLSKDQDGAYQWNTAPFQKIEGDVQDVFLEKDGIAWICTSNGLFRYNAAVRKNYKVTYKTLVRKVVRHDGEVIYDGAKKTDIGEPLDSKDSDKSGHVLVYKHNSLTFEYAAPFYEHAEAITFTHILEGYDKEWSPWTPETKKEYTNLAEGHYCFKVKARNIFNHESGTAEYSFTIDPPWHRTILAYIGYAVGLLAIFALAVVLHFHRVKQAVLRERRKYQKTFLDPQKAEAYSKKLLQLMEIEKPYLDPDINMNSLANELGIPAYHLSQVLNDRLKKNFFDFINAYRVNEAKKMLSSPQREDTILQIALAVGFNSNATFSRVFKKHTGMTPIQYRKKSIS